MGYSRSLTLLFSALCVLACAGLGFGQKPKPLAKAEKQIIFAVLNDGKTVEPIAYLNKGKLEAPVNGSDDVKAISAFARTYYKTGTVYRMIFGGAGSGTVTIKSSNANSECSRNTADSVSLSSKTTLKGYVMALATNSTIKNKTVFRRRPTSGERSEIEAVVRTEYAKHDLTAKELHYQNLTAIDINGDGKAEFVGSYWIEVDKLTRALLFFIAEKGSGGKYSIEYSDYRSVDQSSVMSGDIKDVDNGVYHELLLDSFDFDGDGIGEIFTYDQSFEGAGFAAYKRSDGKWSKVYEFANYHCGY